MVCFCIDDIILKLICFCDDMILIFIFFLCIYRNFVYNKIYIIDFEVW